MWRDLIVSSLNLQVGARLPAYATSAGRVILSDFSDQELSDHLDSLELGALTPNTLCSTEKLLKEIQQVRMQQYSFVDQELALGVVALAIPVYDRRDRLIFALNIAMHSSRFKKDQLETLYLPVMREIADKIKNELPFIEPCWRNRLGRE